MALLTIRQMGDEILTKKCKPVKAINKRILQLADDMFETMYDAAGVGLAAPQVGVLKRMVVIDVTPDPEEGEELKEEDMLRFCMINPEIISADGEQTDYEGCLSYAGMSGIVTRPDHVVVRFTDLDGDECELEGTGLLARAICHELDHLEGKMYVEKVEGKVITNEELAEIRRKEREAAASDGSAESREGKAD
ncbi:MAG: peptide deformylase [Lachnospiraceae bacterium]|nr:peptide deformylase [Lachnospiraceae bacterium]